jgi:hypothetical protein
MNNHHTAGTITFIGMQEQLRGPAFALFNTAAGHTLSESGLARHGLRVPAVEIRADLRDLAVRHYQAARLAERYGDLQVAAAEQRRGDAIVEMAAE